MDEWFGRKNNQNSDQIKNAGMDISINIRLAKLYIPEYIIAHIIRQLYVIKIPPKKTIFL